MEDNDIHESIGKIRGDIEGYELKIKPMVEILSSLLSVFEEKIKRNPPLALKARNTVFSELLTETLRVGIDVHFDPTALLAGAGANYAGFGIGYCIYEKEKFVGIGEKDDFCELLILYEKDKELIKWLSEILEPLEGFREIVIDGLKTWIETIYPVETLRLGRTIYCKRDFKGEDRWIPSRLHIENEPPTESGTSAIKMKIIDDVSNEWKANLYLYEPEGLVNMINELTKGIRYLITNTSMELDS